jgi:hypothetical protein
LSFGNRCEHQEDSAVCKIGASNDLLDPVENDGSGGGKQNFFLIGEQPTGRKSAAATTPAHRAAGPVPVDDDIGKAGAIACVKEPGGRGEIAISPKSRSRRAAD